MFNPGDKVLVYSASWDKHPVISTIERVTKTQVILSNGNRYNREEGYATPYSTGGGHIDAATEGQIATIEHATRIRQMRSAIGEYISKASPGEVERLYSALCERGVFTDPAAQG